MSGILGGAGSRSGMLGESFNRLNLPWWSVHGCADSCGDVGAQVLKDWTNVYQSASDFVNSTGIYHVPVKGKYHILMHTTKNNVTNVARVYLRINGVASSTSGILQNRLSEGSGLEHGNLSQASNSIIIDLKRADELSCYTSTGLIIESYEYTSFVGYFIG